MRLGGANQDVRRESSTAPSPPPGLRAALPLSNPPAKIYDIPRMPSPGLNSLPTPPQSHNPSPQNLEPNFLLTEPDLDRSMFSIADDPDSQLASVSEVQLVAMQDFISGRVMGFPPATSGTGATIQVRSVPAKFQQESRPEAKQRIHLAVKPFPCAHCDKSFSRRTHSGNFHSPRQA